MIRKLLRKSGVHVDCREATGRTAPSGPRGTVGAIEAVATRAPMRSIAASVLVAVASTSPMNARAGDCDPRAGSQERPPLKVVEVLTSVPIQFRNAPEDTVVPDSTSSVEEAGAPSRGAARAHDGTASLDGVVIYDSGREIARTITVGRPEEAHRILARVTIDPVPKDEISVHDPWDRAGNVRLAAEGFPDIELVKFITSYGGVTEHEVDITHLAPMLNGRCTFRGFVDTWLAPAWKLSLSLIFEPAEEWELLEANAYPAVPDWVLPILYEQDATSESLGEEGFTTAVEIPDGTTRAVLCYLSSGHCTDGRDDDEFVSKDNVISVDGVVVERFRPWRDDCSRFRARNPYTRRWSDGWWSSDYSRSGWCPGDWVRPVSIDLTDHLQTGAHVIRFNVEDVRPRDENDHYGYWRLSAYLLGWVDE